MLLIPILSQRDSAQFKQMGGKTVVARPVFPKDKLGD
jgi:hypothetical protein